MARMAAAEMTDVARMLRTIVRAMPGESRVERRLAGRLEGAAAALAALASARRQTHE